MLIKNLNISKKNNDMIDGIEKLFENPIFGDLIEKEVRVEINKLRNNLDNKEINWTQKEQDELLNLLESVLLNDGIDKKTKIKIFITIINQKIQNEIKETDSENLEDPLVIINGIENNQIINKVAKITDKFLGNSDYVLIIVPSIHQKILGVKSGNNISQKLFIQEQKINTIFSELIKNGYCNVYTFEGSFFYEISVGNENGIPLDFIKNYEEYKELSKTAEKDTKKILELQKQILKKGIVNFLPEIEFKDELLSYGIENFISHCMSFDLYGFIDTFTDYNIGIENMNQFIDIFIQEREKIYFYMFGDNNKIREYLVFLRKELTVENIEKLGISNYINKLLKKYIYYKYNKRNKDTVDNIEQLKINTKANGIILRFGSAHFGYPNKELERLTRKGIIEKDDVQNIKQILKEKGISYIEILPKK